MTLARLTYALAVVLILAGCPQSPVARDTSATPEPVPKAASSEAAHDTAALTGPWEDARQRGVAFRAVGNEPGWYAEVGAGAAPSLHAVLDYGERTLDVVKLQPLSGLLGYAGSTETGQPVRLLLERRPCNDGMSDARYPVAARLEVGDARWQGCGRFLAE